MITIKVNVYDAEVKWAGDEDSSAKLVKFGVFQNMPDLIDPDGDGFRACVADSYIDSQLFYTFDTDEEVLNLKAGDVVGDLEIEIINIDHTPEYVEEIGYETTPIRRNFSPYAFTEEEVDREVRHQYETSNGYVFDFDLKLSAPIVITQLHATDADEILTAVAEFTFWHANTIVDRLPSFKGYDKLTFVKH